MGRIADINEVGAPITGYKFSDNDGDIATAKLSHDRKLVILDYEAYDVNAVSLTPEEARSLANVLYRTADLTLED